MKKLSFISVLTMLLCMVNVKAYAYDFEVENGDGVTIYYNYLSDKKELEVTYYEYHSMNYSGEINIPESVLIGKTAYPVTSIGDDAFYRCSSLTSVTIPNSVTSIGNRAFSDCGLTELTIPNSVTSIGYGAFSGCSLTELTIPNSVTSIDATAFQSCSGLERITVEEGNLYYDSRESCNAIISIEDNKLIAGCKNTSIPNSVTSIGNEAFYGCTGLTELTIPNSVTSIGSSAFEDCTGLTEVTIGNGVTSINVWAFQHCSSLTSVTSLIEKPFAISTSTYNEVFDKTANLTLYVPVGTKEKYLQTAGWSYYFANIVEMDYDKITLTEANIATYCRAYGLDFTGVEGLKAYIASGFYPETGTVLLTNVTKVPAGTGIILMGDEGTYKVPHTQTPFYCVNMLKGTLAARPVPQTEGDYTNYILADGDKGVQFYLSSGNGSIAANKAYLQVPTSALLPAGARSVLNYTFEDDETTGIHQTQGTQPQDDAVYNLNGQRVEQPRKGLYIKNGKKVFIH